MDKYAVSGILRTYAEHAINAKTTKDLQEIVRKLKGEFPYDEIKKMKVDDFADE